MLDRLFKGIFNTEASATIEVSDFLLCIGFSLFLGFLMSAAYMYHTRYTKSFVITLATLPAVVCVVIMMVNGNIGTGVAVAGAFSLVRFRSIPGTAKEIGALFLAMGTGLITGMGYLGFAFLFTVILCLVFLLYNKLNLGEKKRTEIYKTLKLAIPEDLNYTGAFDDIFDKYTTFHELVKVKTTNMGSVFKLTYNIILKEANNEKEMIDMMRCRNGNLEICVSVQESAPSEL